MKINIYKSLLVLIILIFVSSYLVRLSISSSSRGVIRSQTENTKLSSVVSGKVVSNELISKKMRLQINAGKTKY